MKNILCHNCDNQLHYFKTFSNYYLVSSDCKPTHYNGELAMCKTCHLIQKPISNKWKSRVNNIYKNYEMFKNASGNDQKLFNKNINNQSDRSSEILKIILENIKVKNNGNLLDIGCGTGPFLKSFSKKCKKWNLFGLEQDDRFKKNLKDIKNFKKLFTDKNKINIKFDLIVMVHTLEHIISPVDFINSISDLLLPNGYLFIEVPDFNKSPFDILVADHTSHFTKSDFNLISQKLDFEKVFLFSDKIPKEISFLLKKSQNLNMKKTKQSFNKKIINNKKIVLNKYLNSYDKFTNKINKINGKIAIFGTSIAATWIAQTLTNKNFVFIDQDSDKIGNLHMNKKIHSINSLIDFKKIIMPFRRDVALAIIKRLQMPKKRFILLDK